MFGHSHQCNEGHFWPPHGRTRQLRARESTDTPTFALWDPIGHRRVEHKQSHQWDRGIWCKGRLLGQRDSRGWASQSLSWLSGPGWVRLLPGRLWQRELFQQREEIQSHHSNLARGERCFSPEYQLVWFYYWQLLWLWMVYVFGISAVILGRC